MPFDMTPYWSGELPEEFEIFLGLIFGPIVLPCYPEADPKTIPKGQRAFGSRFLSASG
jgi:hypothetical protein